MKLAIRRSFFWAALFAGGAAALVWLFHVTADPLRPYRAVPVFCDFVSRHDRPADRIGELARSPVTAVIAPLFGSTTDELVASADAPEIRHWAKRLVDRRLVIASFTVGASRRVWMFASRLDGRAVRLRWMARLGFLPDLRPIGHHQGRRLWMLDAILSNAPQRLIIAFEEGLLVGCWSEDLDDIRLVLDTYDRQIPAMATTDLAERMEQDARADVFVWNPAPDWRFGRWYGGLERIGTEGVIGQVVWEKAPWRLPAIPPKNQHVQGASLFAETPCAIVHLAPSLVTAVTAALGASADIMQWLSQWEAALNSPWTLAIFDGPFSGRLWGLRIPSAAVAFRSRTSPLAPLQAIVDDLNGRYGTTLLLGPVAGDGGLYSLGMADGSFYAALPIEDQAALRTQGDWVLLASQLRVLRKLHTIFRPELEEYGPNTHEPPAWAWGTLETPRLAATIRSALSVAALGLMMQNREKTRTVRERIHQIQNMVQHLSALGRVEFSVTAGADGEPEIWFRVSPIEAASPAAEAAP